MSDSSRRQNASMGAFLHARALSSSWRRVILDAIVGTAVALVAIVLRPPAWVIIAGIGICFASYGLWAIAERELSMPRESAPGETKRVALIALRGIMAVIAVITVMLLMATVVAKGLGNWIS